MPKTLGEQIKLRQKMMEDVKNDYEDRDADVARFINPRREIIRDSQRFDNKGDRRGKGSYAGGPSSALGIWVDGMQGHMVSKSLRWFMSQLGDPRLSRDDQIQAYLQEYDEAMYGEFNRSNFYSILGEWFRDAGSVGTAPLYTEEDISRGNAVMTPIHLREIFISENKYGEVDTTHRKFFLTARQAVDKFGTERLHPAIVENAEKNPEKRHEFLHAVFPNKERMYGSLLSENKPIASVYLQKEGRLDIPDGTVVKRKGYDVDPYAVWRHRKNSDEIYGYSPAHDAMVSIKKAHQFDKTMLKAAQLAVEPALNVPEQMRGSNELNRPNGRNYFERGGDTASAIHNGQNYPVGVDREERIQKIIEEKYRVEFFLILSRAEREMTAFEIAERQSEKAVLLGPQVDRLEEEGLSKVFDIVSDIADKAGRLPEPPQILIDAVEQNKAEGKPPILITPAFTGPLAIAQKMAFSLRPIRNYLNEIAQAAVVVPSLVDHIHPDRLNEAIVDAVNPPMRILRTKDELKEKREADAAALAAQEQQQMLGAAAEAYPKLSGKPDEGSPAEAMAQQLG
jgi:hypothetical protein